MTNENKRKRQQKTTRQQYEIYLAELENNKDFRENVFSPNNPSVLKETWEKITVRLNAAGGPIKDVASWKRTFSDWKAHARQRARIIKCAQKETGNAGRMEKSLTDLEEKLLNLTGRVVVDGLNVPELGVIPVSSGCSQENMDMTEPDLPKTDNVIDELPQAPNPKKNKSSLISCMKSFTTSKEKEIDYLRSMDQKLEKILEFQKKTYKILNQKKNESESSESD